MTYVVFSNPGEIDPRLMTTFGANVKESASPIGFFGTGFKYAIAILLRNSCEVTVLNGMDRYVFSVVKENIRGKDFDMVYMNDKPMGFTLELGKNWKFWTAYRELYSNCMDENGWVSTSEFEPAQMLRHTQVCVKGSRFANIHEHRSQYFLESDELTKGHYAKIHAGQSGQVYYRNIQVGMFADARPSYVTYNFTSGVRLSEDRTVTNFKDLDMWIMFELAGMKDKDLLKRILSAGSDFHEYHLEWGTWGTSSPGQPFLEVVHDLLQHSVTSVPAQLYQYWRQHSQGKFRPEVRKPNEREALLLQKATTFLNAAGFDLAAYPVFVAVSLGSTVMGLAHNGEIFISPATFEVGLKQLVMTLLEEHVHLKYDVLDETRQMQDRLFALLVSAHELRLGEVL